MGVAHVAVPERAVRGYPLRFIRGPGRSGPARYGPTRWVARTIGLVYSLVSLCASSTEKKFGRRPSAVCTSARTSPHNKLFLEGLRAALTADAAYRDGRFTEKPLRGLRAFARIYAGWAVSQTFYREESWRGVGYASMEDWLVRGWEGNFLRREGEDLLSMLDTWTVSDISANPVFEGDLDAALGAIKARTLVMPCTTDLYFQVADNAIEVPKMPNAELRPIVSDWGHRAGNPNLNPADEAVLRQALAIRAFEVTERNPNSSRSHAVCKLALVPPPPPEGAVPEAL